MNLEKAIPGLLVSAATIALTVGYFSTDNGIKIVGAIVLIFVWWVAYDIIVNRD